MTLFMFIYNKKYQSLNIENFENIYTALYSNMDNYSENSDMNIIVSKIQIHIMKIILLKMMKKII